MTLVVELKEWQLRVVLYGSYYLELKNLLS